MLNNKYDQEQRARLQSQRDAETDPAQREAYALAERAGFDWYDTESAARRMAEHAASELVALHSALATIITGCDIALLDDKLPRAFILQVKRTAEAAYSCRRPPRRAMTPTHTGVHP